MNLEKSAKTIFWDREEKKCIMCEGYCNPRDADCRTCNVPIVYALRKLTITVRK